MKKNTDQDEALAIARFTAIMTRYPGGFETVPVGSADRKWLESMQEAKSQFEQEQTRLAPLVLMPILNAAQGGGMTEARAEEIYAEIVGAWANLEAGFAGDMLADVRKVLDSTEDLGDALERYTDPDSPDYDPEFDGE